MSRRVRAVSSFTSVKRSYKNKSSKLRLAWNPVTIKKFAKAFKGLR